jgi:hypothetical protein
VPALIFFFTLTATAEASQESARSKLETARETLRLSQVTYERIAADLEQLKSSGNASPELIKNYEIYLQRVGEMRDENQRILESMEKAYAASASSQKGAPGPSPPEPKRDLRIPEEEGTDRVAALDRQLKESLASFDEMLLKEMDQIRAASGDKMRGLALEAAAAARGIKESEEKQRPEGESQGEQSAQAPGTSKDKDSEVQDAKTGGQDRPTGSKSGKDDSTRLTGRGPDSSTQDDDIVARQLREAAEKETDPVLKEKLWKEYEEYKKSRRQ